MRLIDIQKIINKSQETGDLPNRTLAAIEKMLSDEKNINRMIDEGLEDLKLSGQLDIIQDEVMDYINNKDEILKNMVLQAYDKFSRSGVKEMLKYLNENFDIIPYSEREKELKQKRGY